MTVRVRRLAPVTAVALGLVVALNLASAEATATVGVPSGSRPTAGPRVAATGLPPRLKGTVWSRIPTRHKVVALTFDCGAGATGVRSILTTLDDKNVPRATFFMTGTWARTFPSHARRIASGGYTVGNHSMTHPDLTTVSERRVEREVRSAERAITSVTGVSPTPWFRFPFGAYDRTVLRQVNGLGYAAVGWTVDSLGWQGTSGGQSVRRVVRRVVAAATPGGIVLMHVGANPQDGSTLDADALPRIVVRLRHQGYRFVSVNALLP